VQDEVPISNDVWLPAEKEPNDFMLCTDPADFSILKRSPFNVVLQSQAKGEEDGSLSRLAATRKIRYLNIEAAQGRNSSQRAMLEWAETHLP
jgi:hypothetical protein